MECIYEKFTKGKAGDGYVPQRGWHLSRRTRKMEVTASSMPTTAARTMYRMVFSSHPSTRAIKRMAILI
ncbi:hypothetical protein [Flavobacterium sp.]|uniref:hypothetical protein n=1 Tax=Flavobacterium sp. TaxID=239 RepID=UPI004034BE99